MWLKHPLSQPNSTLPSTTQGSSNSTTHSQNKRKGKKRTDTTTTAAAAVPLRGTSETNTPAWGSKAGVYHYDKGDPASQLPNERAPTSLPNAISTSATTAAGPPPLLSPTPNPHSHSPLENVPNVLPRASRLRYKQQ